MEFYEEGEKFPKNLGSSNPGSAPGMVWVGRELKFHPIPWAEIVSLSQLAPRFFHGNFHGSRNPGDSEGKRRNFMGESPTFPSGIFPARMNKFP